MKNIGLTILLYMLSIVYGFVFSFFLMRFLQKFFFSSIKKGKFNPLLSIPFMFVCAVLLFLPALIHLRFFAVSMGTAIITNFVLLLLLAKQVHPKKDSRKD